MVHKLISIHTPKIFDSLCELIFKHLYILIYFRYLLSLLKWQYSGYACGFGCERVPNHTHTRLSENIFLNKGKQWNNSSCAKSYILANLHDKEMMEQDFSLRMQIFNAFEKDVWGVFCYKRRSATNQTFPKSQCMLYSARRNSEEMMNESCFFIHIYTQLLGVVLLYQYSYCWTLQPQ